MTYRFVFCLVLVLFLAGLSADAQIIAAIVSQSDFFDTNRLQEIRLEIFPADWNLLKLHYLENTRYACDFHWNFNGADFPIPEVSIRSRGQGSRSGVKPSLKVEFDYYNSKQEFLGLKTIVLRANTQDASMMHERVSMELMRRMGIPVPRETHTKLYVNGEYVGLYTIVESIDKPFLRTNLNEDGGYLYNYQYADPFFFEDRGPNPATYSPIPFEPEFNSQTPNPGPLAEMVQAINQASDAQFVSTVSQFVDLNSFIRVIAAENYLAEQDGLIGDYGLNNFYLYRLAGKKVHTFLPWDKSNTFFSANWPILRNFQTNVLSKRAALVPELMAVYRAALASAAKIAGGHGGWLEQEITKEYQQIQQAAYADTLKLCDPGATGGLRPCSNAEFDAAVAFMIAFARNRAGDVKGQLGTSQQDFTITNLGGFTSVASAADGPLKVGYARIRAAGGATTPSGLAIFSLRNGQMVVSEAGVPSSPLIQGGRIYAEVNGAINTGLAIANPNDQPAVIAFYFTDGTGRDFGNNTLTIPAGGQIAQFLDTSPFNSGNLVSGSFTFSSSVPVAAIALRGLTNERSDFLITTLPVSALTPQTGSLVFPHYADGQGWTTQIILINPGDQVLTGTLLFVPNDASSATAVNYTIPIHGSYRMQTTGASPITKVGVVRLIPNANGTPVGTPSGVSIFSYRNGGVTVTEAGVPAIPTGSAFRLYVETSGDFANSKAGSYQTGLAVANSTASAATVNFELSDLSGSLQMTGAITVPPNGQSASFLYQVPGLGALSASFQGVLRISGPPGLSVVGLRGRYNERGDFLITTTPPVDEAAPVSGAELVFPHIVEGVGYTTQFILFSGAPGQATTGSVQYLSQSGEPLLMGIR